MAERPYLLVVNGPNLNRLGLREPQVYGTETLHEVCARVREAADAFGVAVKDFQSNHEGALIDFLQQYGPGAIGIVLNPGAFGHYGYALRDCVADIGRPVIEVHISNVHRREAFRHQLVLAPVVLGQIVGLGTAGYVLAARHLLELWRRERGGERE
ncbi:MAG: type II 3-dehydroquinate dehydratase [Alicyclobacillus macrosporangiidus]|uniref:type II 3-dehydroquinate dehydratase n=1 Tax=Alicyclobacillus macrosporangiidus TaxID=392015 RepID=UPI0026EBD8E5|nr:type II 3-dehydroquinate dehydratase [Alicyclobacillus macrosporangiidus]MCL6598453.1 type II 3-dehydroquinate dehydratase [Alicyclobacillus macrosporangiidus]